MGARIGDLILLRTLEASATVQAWPCGSTEAGKVSIGALTRRSLGVATGSMVTAARVPRDTAVQPTQLKAAFHVTHGNVPAVAGYVQDVLLSRVLCSGELVELPLLGEWWGVRVNGVGVADGQLMYISDGCHISVCDAPAASEGSEPSVPVHGGLSVPLSQVCQILDASLRCPEEYHDFGLKPPKGVLMHGPPGTGKTLLARSLASEYGASMHTVNGAEVGPSLVLIIDYICSTGGGVSAVLEPRLDPLMIQVVQVIGKYWGESEERLKSLFDTASVNAPAIIFLDEVDAIAPSRSAVNILACLCVDERLD